MKNKIKLHGLGNDGNFNYYIFDKKKKIYFQLAKIFKELFKVHLETYDEKNREINVEKYKDFHTDSSASNLGKPRIDIIYGDKKMFVMIHCSSQLRVKFNEELLKIAEMPKPRRSKK